MKTTFRSVIRPFGWNRASGAIAALAAGCLAAGIAGCDDKFDEFREAAAPALESGVNAVLDGLVTGVFAVVEPNEAATATP